MNLQRMWLLLLVAGLAGCSESSLPSKVRPELKTREQWELEERVKDQQAEEDMKEGTEKQWKERERKRPQIEALRKSETERNRSASEKALEGKRSELDRRKTTGVDSEKDDASSADVCDLGALQGLIGEWDYEAKAILPDGEEKLSVGSSSIRPNLGGRFLVASTRLDDGESEALQIWTFCPDRKTYRSWYFHSDGETVEGIGKYDESTRSLTWEIGAVDGYVYERTERFANEDSFVWYGTLTDQEGIVVARIAGKLSRRK